MTVTDAKTGPCVFCGPKNKEVFSVQSPGFSGDVCGKHLFIQVRQQQPKADTAPPAPPH